MIKKIAILMTCLIATSAVQAEMKIVVLDQIRAISGTEEAKTLIEAAQKRLEPDQAELQAMVEERRALAEKLQKDGDVMSDTEKREIATQIRDLEQDLEFNNKKLQQAAQDAQQEIIGSLAEKFQAVLNDLIEVEGYDMILAPNTLIYANQRNDITRRVTERMNEKN